VSHTTFIGKEKYTKSLSLVKRISMDQGVYYLLARFIDLEEIASTCKCKIIRKSKIHQGKDIPTNKLEPGIDLHENQQKIADFLFSKIYAKPRTSLGLGGCIFVMGTGLGKTYIGGAFIEFIKKKTLIVTPNTTLITEWCKMLEPNFEYLDIGQYHSKSKSDGDVVIMTIDSALNDKFTWSSGKRSPKISLTSSEYFKQFGGVIFDEIHNYPTVKRHEIFWRTNFLYALGLTATPDERTDGMDPVSSAHVGKIIRAEEIPGFEAEEIKWKGTVKAIRYHGPPEYTIRYVNQKGWVSTKKMCDQFIADPHRKKLLISEISKLYAADKHIFVFSERRDYLLTLQAKLSEQNMDATDSEQEGLIQTLMGGSTLGEHDNARQKAKIILITYGYGMEGISIPKMDAIIFATPRRRKMRQTIGRILRRSGDPSVTREIIDIIDENTTLRSQFTTRKQVYVEKDFPIKETPVEYSQYS